MFGFGYRFGAFGGGLNGAPDNTVAPVASATTLIVGGVLTTTDGTWSGSGITFSYQWYRGASPIGGATANTYTLVADDVLENIYCQVTATNISGSAQANSNTLYIPVIGFSGTQLYFAKNTATVSLWNDQSTNGYDLTQAIASQQPTISANSVDFDGIDDVLFRNISDPFIADTQGVIFFSFYFTLGVVQYLFCSADNATNNFNFRVLATGAINKIILQVMTDSLNNNLITLDTSELVSGYNYGYVGSNGTSYFGSLNGVPQSMSPTLLDDGKWLSSILNRDNLSIAGWLRNTTTGRYTPTKSNKIYYNNAALSSADLAKLETFFSDPNNY